MSRKGESCSAETKAKMRAYDPVRVERFRARMLGVPKSPEQRAKMRAAKLGVPKSAEHRKNMSIAQLDRVARLKAEGKWPIRGPNKKKASSV